LITPSLKNKLKSKNPELLGTRLKDAPERTAQTCLRFNDAQEKPEENPTAAANAAAGLFMFLKTLDRRKDKLPGLSNAVYPVGDKPFG